MKKLTKNIITSISDSDIILPQLYLKFLFTKTITTIQLEEH